MQTGFFKKDGIEKHLRQIPGCDLHITKRIIITKEGSIPVITPYPVEFKCGDFRHNGKNIERTIFFYSEVDSKNDSSVGCDMCDHHTPERE